VKRNFEKRVAIYHKHNVVITGGYVHERPKKQKETISLSKTIQRETIEHSAAT
jgi:hypothetical protein